MNKSLTKFVADTEVMRLKLIIITKDQKVGGAQEGLLLLGDARRGLTMCVRCALTCTVIVVGLVT